MNDVTFFTGPRVEETSTNGHVLRVGWPEIYRRLAAAPPGRLWGVPRGGQIVAGLTGRAVDSPDQADAIVDDIVDSGHTRIRYEGTGKKFWSLIDKSVEPEYRDKWIVFPWEGYDELAGPESNIVRLLEVIGENPNRDGLKDTPRRVIKALRELTKGYQEDAEKLLSATFDVAYDEMVVLRDIPFWSLCEHHLLPFHGSVDVAYLPGRRIVGISKLARVVDCYARRLQVQERMTQEIANAVNTHLKPRGVGVVVRASHTCMAMRGVQKAAHMVTSCLLGDMRTSASARAEFLSLTRSNT